MVESAKKHIRQGRVSIDIVSLDRGGFEVTVTRSSDKPEIIEYAESVLKEIVRLTPKVIIRRVSPTSPLVTFKSASPKRGGPAGTPEDQKMRIAAGWLRVQGRINQAVYADSQGVAPSTLRRWIRQLRQEGKL